MAASSARFLELLESAAREHIKQVDTLTRENSLLRLKCSQHERQEDSADKNPTGVQIQATLAGQGVVQAPPAGSLASYPFVGSQTFSASLSRTSKASAAVPGQDVALHPPSPTCEERRGSRGQLSVHSQQNGMSVVHVPTGQSEGRRFDRYQLGNLAASLEAQSNLSGCGNSRRGSEDADQSRTIKLHDLNELRKTSTTVARYFGDHVDVEGGLMNWIALRWLAKCEPAEGSRGRKCLDIRKRIAEVLQGNGFELGVGILIIVNTLCMAVEMQFQGIDVGYDIGYPRFDQSSEQVWPLGEDVFLVTERVFTVIFTVELALRIGTIGCGFFRKWINWLDVVVVVVALLDWVANSSNVVNPLIVRLLRLAKLGRGLRVLRMTKVLESLHLLLKCLFASIGTLFWSLCLLLVIQCIAGMIISQLVRAFILDPDNDVHARHLVFNYFGTFSRSMVTMFEVTLANWPVPCRILVDHVAEGYAGGILFYRCLVGFAVLNVIQAVFIQQTLKMAQQDQEVMIMNQQKAKDDYSRKLRLLFKELDTSGDGFIQWDEFCAVLNEPGLKTFMAALEIDVHDLEGLFKLLDDGDGQISVEEFVLGASRIKGPARSIDMAHLLADQRRLEKKVDEMSRRRALGGPGEPGQLFAELAHRRRWDLASNNSNTTPHTSRVFSNQEPSDVPSRNHSPNASFLIEGRVPMSRDLSPRSPCLAEAAEVKASHGWSVLVTSDVAADASKGTNPEPLSADGRMWL